MHLKLKEKEAPGIHHTGKACTLHARRLCINDRAQSTFSKIDIRVTDVGKNESLPSSSWNGSRYLCSWTLTAALNVKTFLPARKLNSFRLSNSNSIAPRPSLKSVPKALTKALIIHIWRKVSSECVGSCVTITAFLFSVRLFRASLSFRSSCSSLLSAWWDFHINFP